MTFKSDNRIISKYQPQTIVSRASRVLAFFVLGIAAVVWIIYQLYYPTFYVATHKARYEFAGLVGAAASAYLFPSVAFYICVILKLLRRKQNAVVLQEGTIIFALCRTETIAIADIGGITLEPYDRAFGRPERLKITLKNGLIRYVRCDIFERSGAELMYEISALGTRKEVGEI